MLAWFLVAIPVSSVVGGPISGLLLELDGVLGLKGWQWLFIVEGLPAVVLGFVVLRLLADRPDDAEWLSPKERDILKAMLDAEQRERPKSSLAHGAVRQPGHHPRTACSSASRSAPMGSASSCRRSSRPAGSPTSR